MKNTLNLLTVLLAIYSACVLKGNINSGGKFEVIRTEPIDGGIRYIVAENPINGNLGTEWECDHTEGVVCYIITNQSLSQSSYGTVFYIDDLDNDSGDVTHIERDGHYCLLP